MGVDHEAEGSKAGTVPLSFVLFSGLLPDWLARGPYLLGEYSLFSKVPGSLLKYLYELSTLVIGLTCEQI